MSIVGGKREEHVPTVIWDDPGMDLLRAKLGLDRKIISNQAFYGKSSQFPPKLAYGLPNPGISKPLMKSDSSDLFPSVTFGRLAIKKMTPCDILSCSFGRSLCHYTQPLFHGDVNHGKWQISHTPIGNRHTGIHNGTVDQRSAHGGFAFVGTDKNEPKQKGRTVYILESPFFTLNEDTTLNFDLYRRASAITLQICFDNMMNCPYEAPPLNKDVYWREGESVLMPKGTSKVYFVATQWKRFKWLAIDNVTINKGRACSSSNEEIRKLANLRL
uniref:MAM domain-containing protein n=1 Tax=Acrobeloides nanus TaxID=290746 RepID=A0A914CRX2_9BILA